MMGKLGLLAVLVMLADPHVALAAQRACPDPFAGSATITTNMAPAGSVFSKALDILYHNCQPGDVAVIPLLFVTTVCDFSKTILPLDQTTVACVLVEKPKPD